MRKIDLHTHILPGIDDGAATPEDSLLLLQALKQQGITDVCLTPHYYAHRMSLEKFIIWRDHAFESIKPYFDQLDLIPHLGAEVFLEDSLFGNETLNPLCLDGGSYILIELSSGVKNEIWVKDRLNRLFANYSVTPILVHLERYRRFFKEDFIYDILRMGCHIQFDINALTYRGQKKTIVSWVKEGLIELVASDCHDMNDRAPCFDILESSLPEDLVRFLYSNNDHILLDE